MSELVLFFAIFVVIALPLLAYARAHLRWRREMRQRRAVREQQRAVLRAGRRLYPAEDGQVEVVER